MQSLLDNLSDRQGAVTLDHEEKPGILGGHADCGLVTDAGVQACLLAEPAERALLRPPLDDVTRSFRTSRMPRGQSSTHCPQASHRSVIAMTGEVLYPHALVGCHFACSLPKEITARASTTTFWSLVSLTMGILHRQGRSSGPEGSGPGNRPWLGLRHSW